jgi:hypothetical protein
MFDFIPINFYTSLYYYILLFVVLLAVVQTYTQPINSAKTTFFNKNFGMIVLVFVLLYIGLRPIHREFADMITYNNIFERYSDGAVITSPNDFLFHIFTKFSSQIMSAQMYFLICASLYVVPLYIVCEKWFEGHWFYAFLFLVSAFSFWAYGTNGIRNGMAGSLFLLGLSREKRVWQIVWIVLAINFHKTMVLPSAGFLLANFYNQPKKMIVFWLLSIPLSLILGSGFESFFATIGFDDDRVRYFTADIGSDRFSSTGFRWDFLAYSATAIFAGWYYIVKKEYEDKVYFLLFNTFVFANAFWVLVIRANYSNRFAYLSWFMIGLVIIYPLLKRKILSRQHQKIGLILVVYFAFTFIMFTFLK